MHVRTKERAASISITGVASLLTCLAFAGMASWGVYIYSSFYKYAISTSRCDRISINNLVLTYSIVGYILAACSIMAIIARLLDMFCLSNEEKESNTLYSLVQAASGFMVLALIGILIAMAVMLYSSQCYSAARTMFNSLNPYIIAQFAILSSSCCLVCLCWCVPLCMASFTARRNLEQGYQTLQH
ncbi:hypothetical protein C9374_010184 [Naegleria lovaniensis]|uniref:Uncharacterized protein n=1 Tax=Naegleria lovaniensis TaxID=51637 RepID=A0AA88GCT7_NAELO|nr:uncharacterized protein C9374_010184 [Naegleria lovaniensis]KAG2375180.1 hypothetical protein C9374_010184 [Naegleria lovaniensis]